MSSYSAPIADIALALEEIAGLAAIAALPGYEDATPDLVSTILDEAAKFSGGVLAPLNRIGDIQGSRLENGLVRTPDGFRDAYARFVAAGWNALPFDPAFGGQGLPWALAAAVQEMWNAANMSFGLCPLLTQGAVELLQAHGNADQQRTYLPNLISGRWTGTMNMTEPQAGSDVGAVRTRAVKDGKGYRITGQKIFITYGEHDLAENIVHMVLARTPAAPPGVKGISLFIVPKYLVGGDGEPGEPNDLRCVSLESKLGIHGSPTAVMAYGDNGGAIAELVGEENRGIEYMFTMMNNARLSIGIQGLAIAERAYQQARDYARTRLQGRAPDGSGPVPIVRHPDVRRMLVVMKAQIAAMRALIYFAAGAIDRAKRHPDGAERARHQALADLLIPVAKAWCTDTGCTVASAALQVHGGVGFIEETGAAQHYRDARIAPIYEGTNGIQALDLLGRKLVRDEGKAARSLMASMKETVDELGRTEPGDIATLRSPLADGVAALSNATDWLLDCWQRDRMQALAGAAPYLTLLGTVTGGWLLARLGIAARHRIAAGKGDPGHLGATAALARCYADNILPQAAAFAAMSAAGSAALLRMPEDQL